MAIFHVTEGETWAAAARAGSYRMSTRGATLDEVGFIHASTQEQLPAVAGFLYSDASESLVVLELDDEAITTAGVPLRWEDGGDGELFPHIYGAIDPAWVVAVSPAGFDERGRFGWSG
ncbi:DUF952 domain-containing protein [Lysinimonas soli]|uniref:DUF952 domain-containing protein n=1 Tax=Lysinimonas soli TaxID=1074233 RepID=A0ABW0NQ73_9MICO